MPALASCALLCHYHVLSPNLHVHTTGRMWERWINWLENGPPADVPPNAAGPEAALHSAGRRALRKLQTALADALDDVPATDSDVMLSRLEGGGSISVSRKDATSRGTRVRQARLAAALLRALRGEGRADALQLALALESIFGDAMRDSRMVGDVNAVARAVAFVEKLMARMLIAETGSVVAVPRRAQPAPTNASSVLAAITPVRYAGTSLATGSFSAIGGARSLLVGSPGLSFTGLPHAGGFNVISYPPPPSTAEAPTPLDSLSPPLAAAPSVFARLGTTACACDLNGDGIDDAAVAAPTEGWNWVSAPLVPDFVYAGAVHIYFGAASGLPAAPSVILAGENRSFFGGGALACGDVDGDGFADVVVGSPMAQIGAAEIGENDAAERGRVDVFLSGPSWALRSGTVQASAVSNASWVGGPPYHWFVALERVCLLV